MKHFSLVGLVISLMLLSENSYAQAITYSYDAVGNRTEKVIDLGQGKGTGTTEKSKKEYIKTPDEIPVAEKAIVDETFQNQTVRIYPNPTQGIIKLEIPNDSEVSVTIQITVQDLNGKMIINKVPESQLTELDLSNQPNGVYLLLLKKGGKVSQWKIIKH